MKLTIDEADRIVAIQGDKEHGVSRGYACFKGMQAADIHHGEARLLHPMKRRADGGFERIESELALDEVAAKIDALRARHGPRSVAMYVGGAAGFNSSLQGMFKGFLTAMNTDQFFSSMTIDQANKGVARGRLGAWAPGVHDLERSEVVLMLGTNPLVSHQAFGLNLVADPTRRLKEAKARGLKLICIDPRRTETARYADLHLRPFPGQDAAILAGLLRVILAEGWEDAAFCARHVGSDRLGDLRAAVAPFDETLVERRAGLEPGQVRATAQMFARDHKAGSAVMTTGGSFAPFANLTQHLLNVLNVVCGRFNRAGDVIPINMLGRPGPVRAEVTPPQRPWESRPRSRIRGAGWFYGERLTPTLAEEILEPGEGQIRCLIVSGGNPAAVVPDQALIRRALGALDLLVTIDPCLTATAELSHYVFAPKMLYERPDLSFSVPGVLFQHRTYAQFTPAVIDPPVGSDVIDDWYLYWSIVKRLGLDLTYAKTPLDSTTAPSTEHLLDLRLRNARVSMDELRGHPSGKAFKHPDSVVAEGDPDGEARFDPMPADLAGELREFLAAEMTPGQYESHGRRFSHLLTSRRSHFIFNSTLTQAPAVLRRYPDNPVFLHPDDMEELGVVGGELIEVESDHGRIEALAQPDDTMRRGVISIVHGWGSVADTLAGRANVNELIDARRDYEAITAMPRMSAIPVNLRALKRG